MAHSFSDDEKRFILAEMLKASSIEISAVVELIQSRPIIFSWMKMALPRGRNMAECMEAAEQMGIVSQHQPPFSQLPQPSAQQQVQHPQQPQQQFILRSSLPPPSLYASSAKRGPSVDAADEHQPKRMAVASAEAKQVASQPLANPPRLLHAAGPGSPTLAVDTPSPSSSSSTRRRGRPSRGETRIRRAGNHSYVPIAMAPSPKTPITQATVPSVGPGPGLSRGPARGPPDGHVAHIDAVEHHGHAQSAKLSPQPGPSQHPGPSGSRSGSSELEPTPGRQPAPSEQPPAQAPPSQKPSAQQLPSQEPPPEPVPKREPSPSVIASSQPSPRPAVASLLQPASSAVITTDV